MRRRRLVLLLLLIAVTPLLARGLGAPARASRFELRHAEEALRDFPLVPVRNARYDVLQIVRKAQDGSPDGSYSGTRAVRGALGPDGERVTAVRFESGVAALRGCTLEPPLEIQDTDGAWCPTALRSLSGWLSLLAPLVAIVMAIVLKEVLLALFLGVVTGAVLLEGGLWEGLLRTLDRHVVHAAKDAGHVKILIFSCLLGAVVALVTRLGGVKAIVEALARRRRSARGAQLSTWIMGTLVFFDDYANALLVGNTMRPISDRLRVSREKLAYLVDCTSAPVACIAVISTWIAAEISYIQGWIMETPHGIAGYPRTGAYQIFLDSIAFSFYPILALVFSLLVVLTRRDFGPMYRAEIRARTTGKVIADEARPLLSVEMEEAEPIDPGRLRWYNGALPILAVIFSVVIGLYVDGNPGYQEDLVAARSQVAAATQAGTPAELDEARAQLSDLETGGLFGELRQSFGRADSYNVLLWASLIGLLVAWGLALGQRLMTVRDAADTTVKGIKAMITACLVLILAWSLSDACKALNTSGYLIQQVPFDFNLLPAAVFTLSALVGFSTGSSWGTMGILVPLTMAYAAQLGVGAPEADLRQILLGSLGGVLAGAVFGDHCSPISDTTVMSSMASGSDHVDHVKTQLPYALIVAVVALVAGYVPAGYGLHPGFCLVLGIALLVLAIRFLGKPVEDGDPSP